MAEIFQSEFFRQVFTEKICIYRPHKCDTVDEDCVVSESKCTYRKETVCRKLTVNASDTEEKCYIEDRCTPCTQIKKCIEINTKSEIYLTNCARNKTLENIRKENANRGKAQEKKGNFRKFDKNTPVTTKKKKKKVVNKVADRDAVEKENVNVTNSYQKKTPTKEAQIEIPSASNTERKAGVDVAKSNENRDPRNKTVLGEASINTNNTIVDKGDLIGNLVGNKTKNEKTDVGNPVKRKPTIEELQKNGASEQSSTKLKSAATKKTVKDDGASDKSNTNLGAAATKKTAKEGGASDKSNTNLGAAATKKTAKEGGASDQSNTNPSTDLNAEANKKTVTEMESVKDKQSLVNTSKSNLNGMLNKARDNENSSKNNSTTEIYRRDGAAINKLSNIENSTVASEHFSADGKKSRILRDRGLAYEARYEERSWFPSSCSKKFIVYDQMQKTQDFSSQCTENGILQGDNQVDQLIRKSDQSENDVFVLRIGTGKRNLIQFEFKSSAKNLCNICKNRQKSFQDGKKIKKK